MANRRDDFPSDFDGCIHYQQALINLISVVFYLADDFNNDSKVDLLLWFVDSFSEQGCGTLYYMENLGNEIFDEPVEIASNFTGLYDGSDFLAADVTQDGFLDIVVVNGYGESMSDFETFVVNRTGFFVLKNLFGEIDIENRSPETKIFEEPLFFDSPLDRPEFVVTDINGDNAPDIMGLAGVNAANTGVCTREDCHNPLAVHLNLNHQDGSVGFAAAQYVWTPEHRQGARFAGLIDANKDGIFDIVTQTRHNESDYTYVEFGTGRQTNVVSELFDLATPWDSALSERSALRANDSQLREDRNFHPFLFTKLGNSDIDAMFVHTKSTHLIDNKVTDWRHDRGAFRWTPANPDWDPHNPTSELYPFENTHTWGESLGHVDSNGKFVVHNSASYTAEMNSNRQNFVNAADLNMDGQIDVFDQVGVYFGIDTTYDARRFTPLVPYDKLGMMALVAVIQDISSSTTAFERTYYTMSQPRVADMNNDGLPDVILPTQTELLVFYTTGMCNVTSLKFFTPVWQ